MATMAVEKVSGLSIARLRSLLHERLVFKRWLSAAHVAEQLFWGSPGNQRESISSILTTDSFPGFVSTFALKFRELLKIKNVEAATSSCVDITSTCSPT